MSISIKTNSLVFLSSLDRLDYKEVSPQGDLAFLPTKHNHSYISHYKRSSSFFSTVFENNPRLAFSKNESGVIGFLGLLKNHFLISQDTRGNFSDFLNLAHSINPDFNLLTLLCHNKNKIFSNHLPFLLGEMPLSWLGNTDPEFIFRQCAHICFDGKNPNSDGYGYAMDAQSSHLLNSFKSLSSRGLMKGFTPENFQSNYFSLDWVSCFSELYDLEKTVFLNGISLKQHFFELAIAQSSIKSNSENISFFLTLLNEEELKAYELFSKLNTMKKSSENNYEVSMMMVNPDNWPVRIPHGIGFLDFIALNHSERFRTKVGELNGKKNLTNDEMVFLEQIAEVSSYCGLSPADIAVLNLRGVRDQTKTHKALESYAKLDFSPLEVALEYPASISFLSKCLDSNSTLLSDFYTDLELDRKNLLLKRLTTEIVINGRYNNKWNIPVRNLLKSQFPDSLHYIDSGSSLNGDDNSKEYARAFSKGVQEFLNFSNEEAQRGEVLKNNLLQFNQNPEPLVIETTAVDACLYLSHQFFQKDSGLFNRFSGCPTFKLLSSIAESILVENESWDIPIYGVPLFVWLNNVYLNSNMDFSPIMEQISPSIKTYNLLDNWYSLSFFKEDSDLFDRAMDALNAPVSHWFEEGKTDVLSNVFRFSDAFSFKEKHEFLKKALESPGLSFAPPYNIEAFKIPSFCYSILVENGFDIDFILEERKSLREVILSSIDVDVKNLLKPSHDESFFNELVKLTDARLVKKKIAHIREDVSSAIKSIGNDYEKSDDNGVNVLMVLAMKAPKTLLSEWKRCCGDKSKDAKKSFEKALNAVDSVGRGVSYYFKGNTDLFWSLKKQLPYHSGPLLNYEKDSILGWPIDKKWGLGSPMLGSTLFWEDNELEACEKIILSEVLNEKFNKIILPSDYNLIAPSLISTVLLCSIHNLLFHGSAGTGKKEDISKLIDLFSSRDVVFYDKNKDLFVALSQRVLSIKNIKMSSKHFPGNIKNFDKIEVSLKKTIDEIAIKTALWREKGEEIQTSLRSSRF